MYGDWWNADATMPIHLFVKRIAPNKTFTIKLYGRAEKLFDNLNLSDIIRIYLQEQIKKYCPRFDSLISINKVLYPYDIFIYPII